MQTLKKGSKGAAVRALQYMLAVEPDGKFGRDTREAVLRFQRQAGLEADGAAGAQTMRALAQSAPTVRAGDKGRWVFALQALLGLSEDGKCGAGTAASVRAYQAACGLDADGVAGPKTWKALLGVKASSAAGGAAKRPVDYKQYDSRWGKVVYTSTGNKKQTIKSSGCGPTAMADIVATWYDKGVTPKTLCALAVKKGFRTANSGTAWSFFKYMAGQYPFRKYVQTSSTSTAVAAVKSGALAVASMGPGYWTKGGHFICLWKADDKYIYANDPASASRKKAAIARFQREAKQYFLFYRDVGA